MQQILAVDAKQKDEEKTVEKNKLLLSVSHGKSSPLSFLVVAPA